MDSRLLFLLEEEWGKEGIKQQHFKGVIESARRVSLIKWKFRIIRPRSVKPEYTIRCQHESSAVVYATVYCILRPSVHLLAFQASFKANCTVLKLLISLRLSILGYINQHQLNCLWKANRTYPLNEPLLMRVTNTVHYHTATTESLSSLPL